MKKAASPSDAAFFIACLKRSEHEIVRERRSQNAARMRIGRKEKEWIESHNESISQH
jgi:hypothetical protein